MTLVVASTLFSVMRLTSTRFATALLTAMLLTATSLTTVLFTPTLIAQTVADTSGVGGQISTNPGTEPAGSIPTSLIEAQQDPAVKSILELDPRSVEQIIRSVDLLIRLDQGELAKRVLERFSQANADEKELAQLAKTFKPGVFIRISLAPDLAPLGQAVAEEVSQAAKKVWFAPARIKQLINDLRSDGAAQRNGGRGNVRNRALAELRDLGTEAVVAIIAAMAQDPSEGNQATLVRALVEMGPQAVDPLTGALQSPADTVRSSSIDALGQLGVVRVIPLFIGWAVDSHQNAQVQQAASLACRRLLGRGPSERNVVELLETEVSPLYARKTQLPANFEDQVELWSWDPQSKRPVANMFTQRQAQAVVTSRMAEQLFHLSPTPEHRRWYLISTLETLGPSLGGSTSLAEVKAAGPDAISDALAQAMRDGYVRAAVQAARLLRQIGGTPQLFGGPGEVSPLVEALRHPDRELQFAAADTILRLGEGVRFAGSSNLVDTLAFLGTSRGQRRAVVSHPQISRASTWAAWLGEMGYDDAISAGIGKKAFQAATETADCEMVLISMYTQRFDAEELLQQLRADRRTALLPVALLATSEQLAWAQRLAKSDPLTFAWVAPPNKDALEKQLARLSHTIGNDHPNAAARHDQAERSLAWLVDLSLRPKFFDVRRYEDSFVSAVYDSRLSSPAMQLLASLGTAESQLALVDLASQNTYPMEKRNEAVEAFSRCVNQHQLMLTSEQILRQYARYNGSASLDRQTQGILGMILDVIESQRKDPLRQ